MSDKNISVKVECQIITKAGMGFPGWEDQLTQGKLYTPLAVSFSGVKIINDKGKPEIYGASHFHLRITGL